MPDALLPRVTRILESQPVTDMHTHCYAPSMGHSANTPAGGEALLLFGIDELVTYHYLVAEVFRVAPPNELPYEKFWAMSKREQADHIWRRLFIDRTPVSEACRGVLTTLAALGLDPNERTLEPYRRWFAQQDASAYVDRVMELANVDSITMTNEVFSDHERRLWLENPAACRDSRFRAVLRIDRLLRDRTGSITTLRQLGYEVSTEFTRHTVDELRRFLDDWIRRMDPTYVATSLPPEFRYPDPDDPATDRFIREVLMPTLEDHGLPWAMMIGARLRVNPALEQAGDMVGKADVQAVVHLCREFPRNRFLVTMLSRENQHELCVAARKFGNLMPFGCWWFLNNPSIIEEITRERVELLGASFIPQHSDARVLDQLVYKWAHSREIIARVLADKYADLERTGYRVTDEHIARDARLLLRDNFRAFARPESAAT